MSRSVNIILVTPSFPVILFIAFGCIVLYFRSKGGYKPIVLGEHEAGDG